MRRFTVFIFLLCTCAWASAADLDALAKNPQWRALLHYNPGATWRRIGRSYIDDTRFFLAKDGQTNPKAELKATIQAIKPSGSQARCDYPARYRYLAQKLGWGETQPLSHCQAYLKWRKRFQAKRVMVVFPASYMNSPSSMFGHTFLRFDKGPGSTAWQSWAVSYAAQTDPNDSDFFYAFRGLTGGYPGYFSLRPYSDELQKYSSLENRDIWEYTLALNQQEIDRLIDHLWELDEVPVDYYFLDENCSFRLLSLIRVARPQTRLFEHWRFTELPVDTVRALDKRNLITQRNYRPSKANQLERFTEHLSATEKNWAKKLAQNIQVLDNPRFKSLNAQRRALIIQAAYRYLRFKTRIGARNDEAAQRALALLRAINKLPPPQLPDAKPKVPPEQGHDSHLWTLGAGRFDGHNFMELGFRYTYHDLLDNAAGFLPGAQIVGLGMSARVYDRKGLRLERVDVASLRSFSPRNQFEKPLSWYVEGGAERVWGHGYHLAPYLQGGAGLSWKFGPFQPFALASARIESNSGFKTLVDPGAGARIGTLFYAGRWQAELSSAGHYFTNGEFRIRSKLAAQYSLTRNNGLRLELISQKWRDSHANSGQIQWRHYFD